MSRNEAKRRFTLEDHARGTAGIECRKDAAVIDETPKAYKDIDAVMAAQADLVEIVHTLAAGRVREGVKLAASPDEHLGRKSEAQRSGVFTH